MRFGSHDFPDLPVHRRRGPEWIDRLNVGNTALVKSRPKLSGAPLAYAMSKVEGTADAYSAFGKHLWADERAVSAVLKELIFLRCSIVNECLT